MKKLWYLLLFVCIACASVNKPVVNVEEKEHDIHLSFVAVGDNLIHGAVYHDAKISNNTYDFKSMYSEIKPYIKGHDISFVNQETILGGKSLSLSHYPQFNSPEEVAEALVDTGFNLVNHASNHSFDKREQGIINTLKTWDQYENVLVAGINRTTEEQDTIRIMNKKGVRIAFLAYAEHTNGIPLTKPYLVNLIDKERIKNDVAKAKQLSDIILVSMHWGSEDSFKVNSFQKEYASYLNELGVDVIIGTHPHTIQPMEMLSNSNGDQTLVIYSLGNFLSAQDSEINMLEGMVSWTMDINLEKEEKSISEPVFTPLVNHFDPGFKNFKVYALKDYTESLAKKHGLQGYKNNTISKKRFESKVREVLGNEANIDL